jgi:hypothetical protein
MDIVKRGPKGVTEPRKRIGVAPATKVPVRVLFRMFVLGSVAVIAAAWAIWRHYSVPRVPMLRPAPTEIEVEPSP